MRRSMRRCLIAQSRSMSKTPRPPSCAYPSSGLIAVRPPYKNTLRSQKSVPFHSTLKKAFGNRVAKADDPVVSGRPIPPLFPTNRQICGDPKSQFWVLGYRTTNDKLTYSRFFWKQSAFLVSLSLYQSIIPKIFPFGFKKSTFVAFFLRMSEKVRNFAGEFV